ncbi:MAG: hypothetical protein CL758_07590 [Chloroflexi bacterium]|nr:hypothetical protein [Chloroflexota bacterium]|tara:strand:+ start:2283 stop:3038 length:756 start_codon:yes stop_codon:yes gene_type:complete
MKKDVVAGLGEIGLPIFRVFSKTFPTFGYDIEKKLMPKTSKNIQNYPVRFLHICIPFNNSFSSNVQKLNKKFIPESIVIHSTIKPETTKKLQKKLDIPIIYSPTRGVHRRMIHDLKRYTKFFAIDKYVKNSNTISKNYANLLKKSGIKSKKISASVTLELSKIICDTSYYGWLINYAQMSKMIADKYSVDYDEMWSFSDEIHEFLGNRPKMFPGFIGGHCVIPNLELMNDKSLNQIGQINTIFKKFLNRNS